MKIRIAGTINDSIVDGPGMRYTIFTQGCPHNCDGCHNPQTHSFDGGTIEDTDDLFKKITNNPLLDGVTYSGGEPFCQAEPLYYLGKKIKDAGLSIIAYTGYTFEYLIKNADDNNKYKELLSVVDVLIDGKFEKDKKSYLLNFKGSSNQRTIDVRKSMETDSVVEIEL